MLTLVAWLLTFVLFQTVNAKIQSNLANDEDTTLNAVRAVPATGTAAAPGGCVCGRAFQKRIVGGRPAKQNAYPFLASIYWDADDTLFCCGAVLNNLYIMTASHCLEGGVSEKDIFVGVGEYEVQKENSNREFIRVAKIIRHPEYSKISRVDSDIALLRLVRPLVFKENVQPICLPSPGEPPTVGSVGTVAGWGTQSFGGPVSEKLLEVEIPVLSDKVCLKNFTSKFYRSQTMICAGHLDGTKDACQGDSGGPLFLRDSNNLYKAMGIISFGRGCATQGLPGVYTKVSQFIDWIMANTKDAVQCPPPKEPFSECGIAKTSLQKRIANGQEVTSIRYPWTGIILVNSNNQFQLRCGCVLISQIWVLTTARCIYDYRNNIAAVTVLFGEHDYARLEGPEEQYMLEDIFINENFNPKAPVNHDIALLKLNIPVTYSEDISAVCLPPLSWQNVDLSGIEGVLTGWGDGTTSTIEQEVFASILTNAECARTYGNYITNNIVCVQGENNGGTCNNDFGGQFSIFSSDNTYKLVGLQAFHSPKGCDQGFPSGCIRITSYLSWIQKITGLKIPQ